MVRRLPRTGEATYPPPGQSPAPVPTPKICKARLFLDADTGHMIDQTGQP